MGVVAWIVVGLIAGWLATLIVGSRGGLIRNLAIGLVGAIVGGSLADWLGLQMMPGFWGSLITATAGAVVFLFIWQAIRRA